MIGYVTLGSNDIPRAAAFYDELLKLLGAGRFMESETMVAWAVSPGKPALGAKDEGAPGPRGTGGFYAGYFRDLDGHKLNCYCWKAG